MQNLQDFLIRRGLPADTINRISQEKIDCDAISVMSNEELAEYIPAYGDRIAVMVFAKCKVEEDANAHSASSPSRKVFKPKGKRGASFHNQNARRSLKRIDMGWMNFSASHTSFKQVTFRSRHRLSRTQSSPITSSSTCSWRERLHTPATINITDSSDDDNDFDEHLLQQVIKDSLSESAEVIERNSTKGVEEILHELNGAVDHAMKKNLINFTRHNVIEGVIRGFQRKSFNPQAELHVRFGGEDGIDDGGLTRECMCILKKEIIQQQIFSGNENSKQLVLHSSALNKGVYKIVGQMIAYMLVHRGPVPNFMDPFLYDVLSKGLENVKPQICNVVEYDLRNYLQKIADSTDASTFFDAVEQLECLIRVSGNASLVGDPGRKDELVESLCQFLVVDNMKPAYSQFAEGLKTLGVLDAVQLHGNSMKELFVHTEKTLTSDVIDGLYKPSFSSPDGSNRKRKEQETMAWWRDFVLNIEEEGNLQSLLGYLTGMDEIPPLGFEDNGCILFRHREDLDHNDATIQFPLINTCSLELRLPVLDSYEMFVERFTAAMTINTFTAI